jgi:hypothetical protein
VLLPPCGSASPSVTVTLRMLSCALYSCAFTSSFVVTVCLPGDQVLLAYLFAPTKPNFSPDQDHQDSLEQGEECKQFSHCNFGVNTNRGHNGEAQHT